MPLLIVLMLFLSPYADATLGGPPLDVGQPLSGVNSALHDPSRPSTPGPITGQIRSILRKGYTIHEIEAEEPNGVETGQKIREYILPNGTVFGVSWRGPGQPDLRELLGKYEGEFDDAIAARKQDGPSGRAPVTLRSRNMILQRSGHMRDVRGMAYLPELLPRGLNPQDIS